MYIPAYSSVTDTNLLKTFIEENSFGALISNSEGEVNVNHYPFLLKEEKGIITLWAHLAKSNPQWKQISSKKCTIVFTGPHAYISPVYYAEKLNVPTWNYTAVHAHCQASVINEPSLEKSLMKEMVLFYESQNGTNWNYELPEEFLAKLQSAIVWIKFEVQKLEGKFKLSQNRSESDYFNVVEALGKREENNLNELLKYMDLTRPDFKKEKP